MFTNREEVLENALRVFAKMNYEKASQMEIVKSRTGLLLPVQAGLVRGGRGQIYIPHPTVRKQVPVHGKFVLGIYRPVCNWGGKYHEQPCKPAR